MFGFVRHYTRPDGRAPLIGDSDDGRLQILSHYFDWEPQDHRYLLALGAALFKRDDFAARAFDAPGATEEVAWLLGAEEARSLAQQSSAPPDLSSCAFEESGRYVLRHAAHHAVVCTDPVGTAGLGNHKHNDIFGFELTISGVPMVVDIGSFVYTSDVETRNRFRSTRAHNTVMIDNLEQNQLLGPFGMRTDAVVRVLTWRPEPSHDLLDVVHTGYERLAQPVSHRRTMAFLKDPFAWVVVDRLGGSGRHTIESSLHLAPGAAPRLRPSPSQLQAGATAALAFLASEIDDSASLRPELEAAVAYRRLGVPMTVIPINWPTIGVAEGWFAPRYGQRVRAPVLHLSGEAACPVTLGYLILKL